MSTVTIEKLDEVYVRIFSEPSIEMELVQFFSYEYPGARFTPQYKARLWDGIVKLFCPIRKTLYVGLVSYVEEFCTRNGYELTYKSEFATHGSIDIELIEKFVRGLKLPDKSDIS